MTLHQGEGDGMEHEHEHTYDAYVYRHAKFECHRLTTVRDIAIIVQVKHFSSLRRSCEVG